MEVLWQKVFYIQTELLMLTETYLKLIKWDGSVEGVTIPEENFKTSEFDYFAKGGRVKKKPFAKRGFGRAYKRRK